jgi:hypothetical protein
MDDQSSADVAELRLSRHDAAIVAAALRQYEPYWRPDDTERAKELSALVDDISRLLADLRPREATPPPSLLGTFNKRS